MLSTNSSSSIQKRRQLHRRQQSLEVPILAAPHPANTRQPSRTTGHRRGLSLDQGLTATRSPPGFQPLLPQDQGPSPSGLPSVRIPLDTTNTGQPPDQNPQHFVQETQPQRPAQPGYHACDFQSPRQQQLNPPTTTPIDAKPIITASQNPNRQQQQALQELQHHLEWYHSTYGSSPSPHMRPAPFFDVNLPVGTEMPGASVPPMHMAQPAHGLPHTPVMQGHSHTVPNTPQSYAQAWPSPPPTNAKHARSQSFQLDVAPMPDPTRDSGLAALPLDPPDFSQDPSSFGPNSGYASSAYSSSQVDPLSPRPQHPGQMPTLFEEPTPPLHSSPTMGAADEPALLLQATTGSHDFNDPDFDFGAPIAVSPHQQMLNNLGPEVPASIVETGVPAYEVQQYIGELSEADNKYPCLYPGCHRRFGRKENVRAHIQTHLGDRQYKCNLCDKTFVRQHDLKRHVAIHSDDRPFVCPCGTGFARHDALTRHRQRGMCHGALPGFEKSEEEKPKRGRPRKERPGLESRVDKASKQRRKNKAKSAAGQDVEESEAKFIYASSSSGASDHSLPVTPPDTSDFDADAFLNMANDNNMSFHVNWRDTPPTSPVTASPAKTVDSAHPSLDFNLPMGQRQSQSISPAFLSSHDSPVATASIAAAPLSPEGTNVFDYASPSASFHGGSSSDDLDFFRELDEAVAPQPDVGIDIFSPPGESNSSQSICTDSNDLFDFSKNAEANVPWGQPYVDVQALPKMAAAHNKSFSDFVNEWLQ